MQAQLALGETMDWVKEPVLIKAKAETVLSNPRPSTALKAAQQEFRNFLKTL